MNIKGDNTWQEHIIWQLVSMYFYAYLTQSLVLLFPHPSFSLWGRILSFFLFSSQTIHFFNPFHLPAGNSDVKLPAMTSKGLCLLVSNNMLLTLLWSLPGRQLPPVQVSTNSEIKSSVLWSRLTLSLSSPLPHTFPVSTNCISSCSHLLAVY